MGFATIWTFCEGAPKSVLDKKESLMNSLGFDKSPENTRVVVAMSGGVDSSVVAAELKAEGYDVIGVTLQLYDHGAAVQKANACCAGRDIHDARRVAEKMDFPHYVLDYEDRFQEAVISQFADSYLAGATPVPCIRCNQDVKFKDLLETARDLDADCMATGHYIQRKMGQKAELHQAADPRRDQSYFLFTTTQEQLEFLRFPIGHLRSKEETRKLAQKHGLSIAMKPDSQDICFVPDGDYARTIRKLRPGTAQPGDIVHLDGRVVGKHDGVINYTIGQRRGLGIGGGITENNEPLYVVQLDVVHHRVIVGPKEALARNEIHLSALNWLGDNMLNDNSADQLDVEVKIRSTRPQERARLRIEKGKPIVTLEEAEQGVAAGQACVFYEPNSTRVLGGGWIKSARMV